MSAWPTYNDLSAYARKTDFLIALRDKGVLPAETVTVTTTTLATVDLSKLSYDELSRIQDAYDGSEEFRDMEKTHIHPLQSAMILDVARSAAVRVHGPPTDQA